MKKSTDKAIQWMAVLLTIILSLLYVNAHSQSNKSIGEFLLQRSPTYAGMFVSGAADGLNQNLIWHYHRDFKATFPDANDRYWNPHSSYQNKYKNGDPSQGARFPGSTTYLAWTTDGFHLSKTTFRWGMYISLPINLRRAYEGAKPWWVLIDMGMSFISMAAGWHFMDKIILKDNSR